MNFIRDLCFIHSFLFCAAILLGEGLSGDMFSAFGASTTSLFQTAMPSSLPSSIAVPTGLSSVSMLGSPASSLSSSGGLSLSGQFSTMSLAPGSERRTRNVEAAFMNSFNSPTSLSPAASSLTVPQTNSTQIDGTPANDPQLTEAHITQFIDPSMFSGLPSETTEDSTLLDLKCIGLILY